MDLPTGTPKPLSHKPLKGPTGARLVLCRLDAGYPEKGSAGRGRWFDNIEGTDAKEFLRAINPPDPVQCEDSGADKWPAVVLMPEEYNLRVGGMSFTELQFQLEKYWGRGAVPGAAGYQDVWVPAWAPENTDNPYANCDSILDEFPLDPAIFSCWVNRESSKWLSYFIAKNHTFGVVHAWFAAFLGVIRGSLQQLSSRHTDMKATSPLGFRMSFDLCVQGYDETINGLPSLPLNIKLKTHNGMQVIIRTINNMPPRRIWDICANTVIPSTWLCGHRCPLTERFIAGTIGLRPISHAWAANHDLEFVWTEANQHQWPIPLPRGVQLEDIRGEMIRLGVRYAWLDVLCLRQQAQPALAKDFTFPASKEIVERREQCRFEEWKVDVPTIGAIYSNQDEDDIYGRGPTVVFMSGLGRPFRAEGWTSERHWFNRVWTLQETPVLSRCLIAGLPDGASYWDGGISGNLMPWNCKIDNGLPLWSAMEKAASVLPKGQSTSERELADLDALLRAMQGRHASNPMDRVSAIAFPFARHESYAYIDFISPGMTLPVYDPKTPIPIAWGQLISSIASIKIEYFDIPDLLEDKYDNVIQANYTPTIQLLCLFPHPSRDHWFPSWAQIQQYPDVSVRDHAAVLAPEGTDYSLHLIYGRVYQDCTLRLIQPSTPETKAIYLSTKDGKDAQLVATVPGIQLQIDSGGKYVLVDISPDRSLWGISDEHHCKNEEIGHEHLPIWQTSVILVCEEVDTLAQLAAERATGSSAAIMRYRLRRVTTLEWDCRLSAEPGPGRWLPFKPSLVHLRSAVCTASGDCTYGAIGDEDDLEDILGLDSEDEDADEYEHEHEDEDEPEGLSDLNLEDEYADDGDGEGEPDNVFCDPKEISCLLSRPRDKWPVYEIYLV